MAAEISSELAGEILALLIASQSNVRGDWGARRDELLARVQGSAGHEVQSVARLIRRNRQLVAIVEDLLLASRKLRHSYEHKTERANNLEFIGIAISKAQRTLEENERAVAMCAHKEGN